MKKITAIIFSFTVIISMLCGCGSNEKSKKLNIVTTIFPCYDWVREILGDRINDVNLEFLIDNGVDLHSYQPTAKDIITISNCDLFVYVGGESDKWTGDVLNKTNNDHIVKLNLMNSGKKLNLYEETVEGMQDDKAETDDEKEYDEHVWLSIKNAQSYCKTICDNLCKLDKENSSVYIENTNNYCEKLLELDSRYEAVVNNSNTKTLLFADRFPFRYLTNDYGLSYYAAFSGCSAESEASFKTITFLSKKLNDLSLPAVVSLRDGNMKIAKTVIKTSNRTDVKNVTMNSMQSIIRKDVDNGETYLKIASENLEALKTALN